MKITKQQLKQIIKEEIETVLEIFPEPDPDYVYTGKQHPKRVAQRKASQEYAQEMDDLNTRFMQARKELGYDDSEWVGGGPPSTEERRLKNASADEIEQQYVSKFPEDLQDMARRWLVDMDDEGY
jgi:hypothetical protein|tara:strand:+ start:672 stop:1046 length:375 start_codon:yes stop_codon:yes gene_type:complete